MTMKLLSALLAFAIVGCAAQSKKQSPAEKVDKYLWLEEVEGEKALEWVKERNKVSEDQLMSHPQYQAIEADFRRILLAKDRLPYVNYSKGYVYNFWQDDQHIRGLWRRATLENYKKALVKWETVLDIDQLAKAENENWVFKGATCLPPEERYCLLRLSRGGKDAVVVREFDKEKRAFVKNGFQLPEAKSNVGWISYDKVFVGTDFGPGSMTKSGYPRQVKVWQRGTPLEKAKLVLDISADDLSASGYTFVDANKRWHLVGRDIDFYRHQTSLFHLDGRLTQLPVPEDSYIRGVHQGRLLFSLKSDYSVGGLSFKNGSLLSLNLANLNQTPQLVYEPIVKSSLDEVRFTRNSVLLGVMENVREKIFKATFSNNSWKITRLGEDREIFKSGSLILSSADPLEEIFIARYEDFLSPSAVVIGEDSEKATYLYKVRAAPSRFKASNFLTEQFEATSKDGTKVPYFVIRPNGAKMNGKNPTVLYGYGGFMIPMTPYYLNATGRVWLEHQKGVYIVANIRGGGEFGPAWHQAALKENRQKAYDDFIAVAEDLIERKITSKSKLAIMGGSNGGLLVGATMVQRPDLFKAVVCQVPLLDMLRYHTLLAGHSWVAEYGNPDIPEEREAILKYSPYQNLSPRPSYPMTLFVTSTKDDRVHPGHARKMMAKMMEYAKPALYWENTEGGHAGAANLEQRVKMSALQWTFLVDQLVDVGSAPKN